MPREKVERPADPAVRRANLRRIARLFRPYSRKLSVVTVLIVVASGLGVVSPFLLRAVLDSAIVVPPHHAPIGRLGLLTELVGGMIAISPPLICTGEHLAEAAAGIAAGLAAV